MSTKECRHLVSVYGRAVRLEDNHKAATEAAQRRSAEWLAEQPKVEQP